MILAFSVATSYMIPFQFPRILLRLHYCLATLFPSLRKIRLVVYTDVTTLIQIEPRLSEG
jgi:hypothetical protein